MSSQTITVNGFNFNAIQVSEKQAVDNQCMMICDICQDANYPVLFASKINYCLCLECENKQKEDNIISSVYKILNSN